MDRNNDHRLEVRLKEGLPFLAPERDILVWFRAAVDNAFMLTDPQMADLPDDELKKELEGELSAVRDWQHAIYCDESEAWEVTQRLWDRLSATRGGRLFLGNIAMSVLTMFVDASRRSVEKPSLRVDALKSAMAASMLRSLVSSETADRIRADLRGSDGFGEFVPGMYVHEEIVKEVPGFGDIVNQTGKKESENGETGKEGKQDP